MPKRILVLTVLLLALAAPAALAAGAGGAQTGSVASVHAVGVPGHPLAALRARIRQVGRRVIRRCQSATGDQLERCKQAAKNAIQRLQRIDARIDDRIAKIQGRCTVSGDSAPKGCGRADERIDYLRKLQTRVREREQKLQDWLAKVGG